MRTITRWLLMSLVLTVTAGTAYAIPRLTVKNFEDRTQEQDAPASAIQDMMVTELINAGVFELVEREKIDEILDEHTLSMSGFIDPSMILETGKGHSAQYEMHGAIALYFYNEKTKGFTLPIIGSAAVAKTAYVLLEIRIIDNTTSRIIYASEQLGSAKQNAKGNLNSYQGFFIGGHQKTYGGILALATRDAVKKHVKAIRAKVWE